MPSRWGWSSSATWGSETPKPIHFKCGICDYVHSLTPHENMVAGENGGGVAIWVKLYPRVLFYFFLVPSMLPQLTLKSVDFRSVHPKTCLLVGMFLWGRFAQGVKPSLFLPPPPKKKTFFNGPSKAIILHGSE